MLTPPPPGAGGVQVPREGHPDVGAGGGEREGVPDAEAVVVLNQRTGSPLQLHAE